MAHTLRMPAFSPAICANVFPADEIRTLNSHIHLSATILNTTPSHVHAHSNVYEFIHSFMNYR